MSKIDFLFDDVNVFSQPPISHSRQGWKDLVQRILNNELSPCINEYKIEENERMYKIHRRPFFRLPIKSKSFILVGSIIRYSILKIDWIRMMLVPSTENKLITQKHVTSNRFDG